MELSDIIWIFWILSELYFNIVYRAKSSDSKGKDKYSYFIIWGVISVAITASILIATNIDFQILDSALLKYAGGILIITGVILRFSAIRTMGKLFTVNLTINKNHRLIDNGLYKFIRHPAYSGTILSFIGLALSSNNWVCLPVILLPIIVVFLYRIHIEEKLLLQQSGLSYAMYMKTTKRLIPFIF